MKINEIAIDDYDLEPTGYNDYTYPDIMEIDHEGNTLYIQVDKSLLMKYSTGDKDTIGIIRESIPEPIKVIGTFRWKTKPEDINDVAKDFRSMGFIFNIVDKLSNNFDKMECDKNGKLKYTEDGNIIFKYTGNNYYKYNYEFNLGNIKPEIYTGQDYIVKKRLKNGVSVVFDQNNNIHVIISYTKLAPQVTYLGPIKGD